MRRLPKEPGPIPDDERLMIYEAALAFIESPSYDRGFCFALTQVIKRLYPYYNSFISCYWFYPYNNLAMQELFPELWKYKPTVDNYSKIPMKCRISRDDPKWFAYNEEGLAYRRKILTMIISKLKKKIIKDKEKEDGKHKSPVKTKKGKKN